MCCFPLHRPPRRRRRLLQHRRRLHPRDLLAWTQGDDEAARADYAEPDLWFIFIATVPTAEVFDDPDVVVVVLVLPSSSFRLLHRLHSSPPSGLQLSAKKEEFFIFIC